MNYPVAAADPVVRPVAAHGRASALDSRRKLQLALGVIWLLDAMLQFQPFMFGRGFAQMLAGGAHGNPAFVGRPVAWSAAFIGHHVIVLNTIFAAIQLLLGLGIAWRPTVRLALAASVPWALALLPATRAPRALSAMIAGTRPARRARLAGLDRHPRALALARHGPLASLLLAAVLAAVALLPSMPLARPARIRSTRLTRIRSTRLTRPGPRPPLASHA